MVVIHTIFRNSIVQTKVVFLVFAKLDKQRRRQHYDITYEQKSI